MSWSVREALEGRRILLTGVTGFLGKVWLAHLLEAAPGVARVHLLVRAGRARGGARGRLEDLLATSPAFWPLHERHGAGLGRFLGARLDVLAGDVASPDLGLDAATLARLEGRLDLVLHLAGVTDLEPDVEQALATNVDGARHALEVARRTGARLLHVSTAYVAGRRRGLVAERIERDAPSGDALDARTEVEALRRAVARAREEAKEPDQERALRDAARAALRRHGERASGAALEEWAGRERDRWVRARADEVARARARARGWPNVYTMSKGLAEAIVDETRGDVPVCVVRPSIVEGALSRPFPGWKEGLETSGPLTWAMARGPLRSVPARPDVALDVIPVDFVARGVSLAAAALLAGPAPAVVHLSSAATNPLPVRRAVDLTALAERDEREAGWRGLLTPGAEVTGDLTYRVTSAPWLRRLAAGARGLLESAGEALPEEGLLARAGARARSLAREVGRAERRLADLEATVERFRHFLEHDAVFAGDAAQRLHEALDPRERDAFGFDPRAIDWRRYWLEAHVPGLRRWVWPRLEGHALERLPRRPVTLQVPEPADARA